MARLIRHLRSALPEYLTRLFTRSPREELSEQLLDRLLPAQVWVLVHRQASGWVVDLTIPLPGLVDGTDLDSYLNAVAERSARRMWPACGTSSRPGRSR